MHTPLQWVALLAAILCGLWSVRDLLARQYGWAAVMALLSIANVAVFTGAIP